MALGCTSSLLEMWFVGVQGMKKDLQRIIDHTLTLVQHDIETAFAEADPSDWVDSDCPRPHIAPAVIEVCCAFEILWACWQLVQLESDVDARHIRRHALCPAHTGSKDQRRPQLSLSHSLPVKTGFPLCCCTPGPAFFLVVLIGEAELSRQMKLVVSPEFDCLCKCEV